MIAEVLVNLLRYLGLLQVILVAYLLGSIPFGYIIAKSRGVDITKVGSGNIGMANVYRTLGPGAGITVLILDALKGFTAVSLAYKMATSCLVLPVAPPTAVAIAGAAAIAGHNWSAFLNFRGGKGIATSAGVLAYMAPLVLIIGFSIWLVVTVITGYSALGSLLGAVAGATIAVEGLLGNQWASSLFRGEPAYMWFVIIASLIAIYRHKSNIKRLIRGEENKLYLFKKSEHSNEERG